MPLSEHEQRQLAQMERALNAEDPKFASALSGTELPGRYRRRAVLGVIGTAVGLALLPTGIGIKFPPASVLGFLIMLGSAYLSITSWRRVRPAGGTAEVQPHARAMPGSKVTAQKLTRIGRLEERWRRRRGAPGR